MYKEDNSVDSLIMELKGGLQLRGDGGLYERFSDVLLKHYQRRYGISEDQLRALLDRDEDLEDDLDHLVTMSVEIFQQLLSDGVGLVF